MKQLETGATANAFCVTAEVDIATVEASNIIARVIENTILWFFFLLPFSRYMIW